MATTTSTTGVADATDAAGAPGAAPGRLAEARRLLEGLEHAKSIEEGRFSALGMLITDASLCADEPALTAIKDGLQWLHRTRYLDVPALDPDQREERGRVLGLIDVAHWALRRMPSGLQLGLRPGGHAARFLVAVAARPGRSNRELAAELGTDDTEISRVGRRLLAAGVVWRRKEWRSNLWDITPRGRAYLAETGLLPAPSDGDAPPPSPASSGPTRRGVDPDPSPGHRRRP
ncbi:MarR family transcriptional regulator [Actinomadura logoneensis]|uniref:MarR family transcriptional regulator n=1 Tax=Actinomadura logoneensis TaxID=2293572 RepID=A0A372JRZ5_9ACTN|nr:MarR family winged helix-turn-helix transcriptional regulator [Actinomadura logoneensis]RFU42566.1 MarR family transcriptional regulator [Actinomadura logoneensis]